MSEVTTDPRLRRGTLAERRVRDCARRVDAEASMTESTRATSVLAELDGIRGQLEDLYRDVHEHPELSMQEHRTAGKAAERLDAAGYDVTTGIGGTGVVGLLRNGDGPTVMLRADMDALPVQEATGLPYASTARATDGDGNEVPVMHACGHDMHVTWLAGAAALLAQARDAWHGTLLAVFQPAEETAQGARAMIDDGLFTRFPKPDVVLGQHVMPSPAGQISYRPGTTQAASDSLEIRMFGRGGHGSMPESTVDPVVMAASTVLRLQSIVSREIAALDAEQAKRLLKVSCGNRLEALYMLAVTAGLRIGELLALKWEDMN